MKTLIVTATQKSMVEVHNQPLLNSLHYDINSVEHNTTQFNYNIATTENKSLDICIVPENKKGLPTIYNYFLEYTSSFYECVIFVHDDVAIQHHGYIQIIKKQFQQGFSVVGLAGTSQAKLKSPALWHLMSDSSTWSGAVAHPVGDSIHMTAFGLTPKRCLLLDGLFLAVKTADLKKANVKFDEQFNFHHYDLDFSLSVNKAGLKMTTAPIWVTHLSPGLNSLEDPSFQESQKLFLSKWTK